MLRLASIASALALVACADTGDEAMFILNNTSTTGLDTCALTGDTSQAFIPRGTIDKAGGAGYLMTPLIQSRLSVGAGENPDPIQKTILITGAEVRLSGAVTTSFTSLFSAGLMPGGSVNGFVEAIKPSQLASVPDGEEIVVELTIKGTQGGKEVSSTPFTYPVSVCTNCVVIDHGACPIMITQGQTLEVGNACNPYQDGHVDCCTDNGVLRCPGPYVEIMAAQ